MSRHIAGSRTALLEHEPVGEPQHVLVLSIAGHVCFFIVVAATDDLRLPADSAAPVRRAPDNDEGPLGVAAQDEVVRLVKSCKIGQEL